MAKPDQGQAYLEHLRRDTFPQLRAVVPDNVRRMMVEFDERVRHYEVVQA